MTKAAWLFAAWMRSAALFCARAFGAIAERLSNPLLFQLLMIAGVAEGLFLIDVWRRESLRATTDWLTLENVLAVWAFGFVIAMLLRARRRVVIGRFEDFSDKKAGIEAAGFGVLVTAQLSELTDLFREFEKGRAIQSMPDALKPLNAFFEAEGAAADLDAAFSSDATFALGPLKLPVGFVVGLLSRLVRGPRLSGQLHRDGRTRVITVQLAGRLGTRTWTISDEPTGGETGSETWRPTSDLAGEVACRVFAEMAIGNVNWAALAHYASGVRAYRKVLLRPEQRKVNLRAAERHLIEATSRDPRFDLAYYDLGVVYKEMDNANRGPKLDSAAAAFERALQEDHQRWSTHYALATIHFERGDQAYRNEAAGAAMLHLSAALDHCREALRYAADAGALSDILSMSALVHWVRGLHAEQSLETRVREFSRASSDARRGVRKAWRSLCAAEIGFGIDSDSLSFARGRAQTRAVRSLTDLGAMAFQAAVMDRVKMGPRSFQQLLLGEAVRCYRQAVSLSSSDANLLFDLGRIYVYTEQWKKAAEVLRLSSHLKADRAETWALLTLALVHLDQHLTARETTARTFEYAESMTPRAIEAIVQASAAHKSLMDKIEALRSQATTRWGRWVSVPKALRLMYRVGERRLVSFPFARVTFTNLIRKPEARQAKHEPFEESAARAQGFFAFRDTVANENKLASIAKLKKICAQQRDAGHAWEFAHAAEAVTNIYRRQKRWNLAAKWLRKTIAWLDTILDREVKRRGLDALLSEAFRQQKLTKEAFAQATSAIARDPLSAYERNEMGWVLFQSGEYAAAQEAWQETLLLSPNDAALNVRLGHVHLMRIDENKEPASRRAALATAQRYLETALGLYEQSDADRLEARFFLASVHGSGARYIDAIRELLTLERAAGYCTTVVRLNLADAYLGNENWGEAQRRFSQLAAELDAQLKNTSADSPLESPPGAEELLGSAAAFAHLGTASALGGRDIKLDDAVAEVAKARAIALKLSDPARATLWLTRCDYYEGWLQLKLEKIDEAIKLLEAALSGDATPDMNLVLCEALVRRVERRAPKAPVNFADVRRARAYYEEAKKLDWLGQLEKRLPALNARLTTLERTN